MTEAKDSAIRHVACAVRGRLANRNAVRRAIDLAHEHDARLTFFLVMPDDFLTAATPSLTPAGTLRNRLIELGEYILDLLRDRAIEHGVMDVETTVRIGQVRQNLLQFAKETTAQLLVMGRPSADEPRSVFAPGEFDDFIADMELSSGLKLILVDPE